MTLDSKHFIQLDKLEGQGFQLADGILKKENDEFLPLYEAKLIQQFDHRHGTFEGLTGNAIFNTKAATYNLSDAEKADPCRTVVSRYWVDSKTTESAIPNSWKKEWFIAFRDIIQAMTNARCAVFTAIPRCAVSNKSPLLMSSMDPSLLTCLLADLNSFLFDFCTRQKIGGTSLNFYILEQLPIISPTTFLEPSPWNHTAQSTIHDSPSLRDWLLPRVLELTYTAWDLEAFAADCGWPGPPFRWDEDRRFLLRCELDAAFFHLYLGSEDEWRQQPEALTRAFPTPRHAVSYIMDTFPIVKRKDEAKHGTYRTKETILQIYDALAQSIASGVPYQTLMSPPPADPACCHPAKPVD